MSEYDFALLLEKISPKITKQNTPFRAAIPVNMRLGVTLRFLATGDSYTSLMYLLRISKQQISKIIPEVCEAIFAVLKDEYMKMPDTKEEWLKKEQEFNINWNFNHCIAAIDGKHVVIQAPANTGSLHYNYKGSFSLVLLAVVDANYTFTYIDVGCQGRISDGGVFKNCSFYQGLMNGALNLPEPTLLPGRKRNTPFVIVADEAFPLTENIMKPYSGTHSRDSMERIFNYRLSRARNVVENTFGILSAVFRVLRKPLCVKTDTAISVVLACTAIHNFLRRNKSSRAVYSPAGTFDFEDIDRGIIIPGIWRNERESANLLPLRRLGRKCTISAKDVRIELATYFASNVGRVPWQNNSIDAYKNT